MHNFFRGIRKQPQQAQQPQQRQHEQHHDRRHEKDHDAKREKDHAAPAEAAHASAVKDGSVFSLLLSPIQQKAIPPLLDGRDIIGCAQTGTGKTAAFVLPILQHLANVKKERQRCAPRVLILAPTRELAAQIGEGIAAYGKYLKISHTVIFGGVGQGKQVQALQRGVDIVVATPGRLLDLKEQGCVSLKGIEIFVLDEADRMLDMGFIHDIRKIIAALPHQRQTLFFSATMEPEVRRLAQGLVQDPVQITIDPEKPAVDRIGQKVYFVDDKKKTDLLAKVLKDTDWDKVIIFVQMKHMADRVVERLAERGITACAIHGNKSQGARETALGSFKSGKARVLVATDIAARGIDVKDISHVINFQIPVEAETYVHRIGRTARAGRDGDAYSFCCANERDAWRRIEKLINKKVEVVEDLEFHSEAARNATGDAARPAPKAQQQRRQPADGVRMFPRPYERRRR